MLTKIPLANKQSVYKIAMEGKFKFTLLSRMIREDIMEFLLLTGQILNLKQFFWIS